MNGSIVKIPAIGIVGLLLLLFSFLLLMNEVPQVKELGKLSQNIEFSHNVEKVSCSKVKLNVVYIYVIKFSTKQPLVGKKLETLIEKIGKTAWQEVYNRMESQKVRVIYFHETASGCSRKTLRVKRDVEKPFQKFRFKKIQFRKSKK